MRRTTLRRTRMRPWHRAEDDKVSPELVAYILDRDRICIAARLDPEHRCMTRFRQPHTADDRRYLTIEHVHEAATTGKRAKSDKWHTLAACGWANNEGWCGSHKQEERDYLAKVEPQ